jgi:geranylgeranyl diphosphate synthase type II
LNHKATASLEEYLRIRKELIDEALNAFMPGEEIYPLPLFKAVRYSLMNGGKRIRPILCLAAAEAVEGNISQILPVACSIELIHTYSLIHDDLPAMDNDDYRRGKLTTHKAFGEHVAILAGDALLTEAFHLMARRELMTEIPPEKILCAIRDLAEAIGYFGMVGGQAADILSEGSVADLEILNYIHSHKTAALITASVKLGAFLAGAGEDAIAAISSYGNHVGLAFQITDDILNVIGNRALLGKNTGSDASRGKLTYPALIGLEAARNKARELIDLSLADIGSFDQKAWPLRMIAKYTMERKS